MANRLKMGLVESIRQLHRQGWSQRRIARELNVNRETVARHLGRNEPSKPAIAPPGSETGGSASKPAIAPRGSEASAEAIAPSALGSSEAAADGARAGRRSDCEPYRQKILDKLEAGLSAQRVYQDLVEEHGFTGSYYSVRRFIVRLGEKTPMPFRRLECGPGEEAQVDFGTGAPIVTSEGKRQRTHVFC